MIRYFKKKRLLREKNCTFRVLRLNNQRKNHREKMIKEIKLKHFKLKYGYKFYDGLKRGYMYERYIETKEVPIFTAFDVWNYINMPDLSQFSLEDIDFFIRKIIKNLDRSSTSQTLYGKTLLDTLKSLKDKKGGDKSILCLYKYLSQHMKSTKKGDKSRYRLCVRLKNSNRVIEKEQKEKKEKEKRHEERKIRVLRKMERLIDKGVHIEKIQDLV